MNIITQLPNDFLTFYTVSMKDYNNKVDCGVFVCCYAYGMFKLKEENIEFTDIEHQT